MKVRFAVMSLFCVGVALSVCLTVAAQEESKLPPEMRQKIDALIDKLTSNDYRTRESADKELRKLFPGEMKTFDSALAYLKGHIEKSDDPEVKTRVERITKVYLDWGITGHLLEKIPKILERLTSDDKDVRRKVVGEIGVLNHSDAVAPLVKMLGDEDEQVRWHTAWTLGMIGKAAVTPLIKALSDRNEEVRYYAAEALGNIGDKRAVEPRHMRLETLATRRR